MLSGNHSPLPCLAWLTPGPHVDVDVDAEVAGGGGGGGYVYPPIPCGGYVDPVGNSS